MLKQLAGYDLDCYTIKIEHDGRHIFISITDSGGEKTICLNKRITIDLFLDAMQAMNDPSTGL